MKLRFKCKMLCLRTHHPYVKQCGGSIVLWRYLFKFMEKSGAKYRPVLVENILKTTGSETRVIGFHSTRKISINIPTVLQINGFILVPICIRMAQLKLRLKFSLFY